MRRSKVELYLHLVWATRKRDPIITADIERDVYRSIEAEARSLKCSVLAIGGMPDHIHLALRAPAMLAPSEIAKQVKGVSSLMISKRLPAEHSFYWQEGYGVFSISRSHVPRVIQYVRDQKTHHADATLWPEWEAADEEAPPDLTPETPSTDSTPRTGR